MIWKFNGEADNNKTIKNVVCESSNGQTVNVQANFFVIAGGALESPLILERMLGPENSERLGVGRYLCDHLSLRFAEITDFNRNQFETLFAPFFTGPTMRSLRLCLPDTNDANSWSYCHFVIEAPENSGFAVVRDILRGLQIKNYQEVLRTFLKLPKAMGEIIRMLWMRYAKQRLAISKGSRIFINIDVVKMPQASNRIYTNNNEIVIDWKITENLQDQIKSAFNACNSFWNENKLHHIGVLTKIESATNGENALDNMYDIYHPAGTCAIGRVVDSDLKIHGITNGFVVGSSVFHNSDVQTRP